MHIVNGFADYNAGLAGSGREDIGGESGPNQAGGTSSIANVGGTLRLTVPIAFTYMDELEGEPVVVNLNGTFTANEVASPLILDLNGAATGRDSLAGFIRAVDVGDQDAVGSQVEGLLDSAPVMESRNPHHGLGAPAGNGA